MYQELHDRVQVLAHFHQGQLKPLRFLWQHRSYHISHITTSYQVRQGAIKLHHYAVQSGPNIYQLVYHPLAFTWTLTQVYLPDA